MKSWQKFLNWIFGFAPKPVVIASFVLVLQALFYLGLLWLFYFILIALGLLTGGMLDL